MTRDARASSRHDTGRAVRSPSRSRDDRPRRRPRRHRRPQPGRAAATGTTGGICDELAALGWDVRELVVPGPWPRPDRGGPVPAGAGGRVRAGRRARPARRADRVRRRRRPGAGVRAGCGWSSWCTCRSAASPSPRRPNAPSSRMARAVVTTSSWTRERLLDRYRLPAGAGAGRPSRRGPGRRGARHARRRAAALRRRRASRTRATTSCSRRCGGIAEPPWSCTFVGALDRDPAVRRATPPSGRRVRHPRPDLLSPDRGWARSCAGSTGRRTCWCSRHGSRRTAWSSPRPWRSGCRSSRPPSAGCPRRWGAPPDGLPGVLVPPDDADAPRRGARRLVARRRSAGAAAPGGPRTTDDVGGLGRPRRDTWPRRWSRRRGEPAPALSLRVGRARHERRDAPGVGVGTSARRCRDPRGPRLAPGHRSVPGRGAPDQRLVAAGRHRRSRC